MPSDAGRPPTRTDPARTRPPAHGAYPVAQRLFAEAMRHHQAGRQAEAQRLYQRILAVAPSHPGSLHNLGVIARSQGRAGEAIE